MADLDAENPEDFAQAANVYRQEAGALSDVAKDVEARSAISPTGIEARQGMIDDLNTAYTALGANLRTSSEGILAYESATRRVGALYQNQRDVSTQLLGTVLNSADRFDKTTDPGGR